MNKSFPPEQKVHRFTKINLHQQCSVVWIQPVASRGANLGNITITLALCQKAAHNKWLVVGGHVLWSKTKCTSDILLHSSHFFYGELGCNNSWNYKLVMGKLPTHGPPAFITPCVLFWEGQGDRGRSRRGEEKERLMEWGGCKGRERQSGDGKWQYNMIWFVVRNGFSMSIFRERGDGARREPGRGTSR